MALGLTNALGQAVAGQSPRCLACHAPNATIPAAQRLTELDRSEGVACETCHSPAEAWLRSHTRPGPPRGDFNYADKVSSGLRDLRDLRVRANVCVACHENVERAVLQAGHPELIFELDGQTRQEPRHWVEKEGHHGAKAWLVGQAVSWREVAWLANQPGETSDRLQERLAGLDWVVTKSASALHLKETAPDAVARAVAARNWTVADTTAVLQTLTGATEDFRQSNVSIPIQARRAERLVLGLDRLVASLPEARARAVETQLNELFRLAQSLPDFNSLKFSTALTALAGKVE